MLAIGVRRLTIGLSYGSLLALMLSVSLAIDIGWVAVSIASYGCSYSYISSVTSYRSKVASYKS